MSARRLRAIVVDDEQPARERLRRMLSAIDGVEVVGEAEDGEGAIARIASDRPDVVFLDVQMPGCDGLEVAASLPSPGPRIVFCTAYDEYAVDAFELHAVDYLLKPVTQARLEKAIGRVRAPAAAAGGIEGVGRTTGSYPSRFVARRGSRFRVVPARDVLCFVSEDGVTILCTSEHRYWMQPTLAELEARVDPDAFFRISRSTLVRLDAVEEVVPWPGGQGEVRLGDGTTLEVSRRRFRALLERLGEA